MNNEKVRKILTDRHVTPRAPMHPGATLPAAPVASDFLRGVVVGSIGTVISTLLFKVLL